jgi:hypothetical protein
MNKVKIIIGPNGSGKTLKAKELSEGLKTQWISGRSFNFKNATNFEFSFLETDVECVIIDDIDKKDFVFERIFQYAEGIYLEKQGKEGFSIQPKFILVFDNLSKIEIAERGLSFTKRIELINLRKLKTL